MWVAAANPSIQQRATRPATAPTRLSVCCQLPLHRESSNQARSVQGSTGLASYWPHQPVCRLRSVSVSRPSKIPRVDKNETLTCRAGPLPFLCRHIGSLRTRNRRRAQTHRVPSVCASTNRTTLHSYLSALLISTTWTTTSTGRLSHDRKDTSTIARCLRGIMSLHATRQRPHWSPLHV